MFASYERRNRNGIFDSKNIRLLDIGLIRNAGIDYDYLL